MATGGMKTVPVDSVQHIHLLREYRELLQSTMGTTGSFKVIVTGGGYTEVTSSSAALAARLELSSPICQYINNMVAAQPDHGLYTGILLSYLLEQQWQESKQSMRKNVQTMEIFVNELKSILFSEDVCIKLDFDSIRNILPLVKTVITSKSTVLAGMDVDGLSLEIIKVFLNCIDDETNMINRIYTRVESGLNTFFSCKGLLYRVTENYDIEFAKHLTGVIKILVFVLKLEEDNFLRINEIKNVLAYSAQYGVNVVACQKTVSPEIKLLLRRKKIILLERMGSDFTKMLIEVSHALPLSQLNIAESEIERAVGQLSMLEHVRFNDCDYLALHNSKVPIGTLLVQTSSLLGEDPLKELIIKALTALSTVAVRPFLTLGGGCLETWLIGQIHHLKNGRDDKDFRTVSTWLQKALKSTICAVEIDTLYHHGWREEERCCNCGLVGRKEVEKEGGSWLTLLEVVNCSVNLEIARQPDMTLHSGVLVESHHQKVQVIFTVLEVFANLSTVGSVVHEN